MAVLLKDALKPNLIQTLEGQPCLMHAGPFANIAHGNTSLVADLIGLKLGDYVITESGFGSDMGMEKFIDIVCRVGGMRPSAVVLVATVRALKHHGGIEDDPRVERVRRPRGDRGGHGEPAPPPRDRARVRAPGRRRRQPAPEDTDEEVELVKRARARGRRVRAPRSTTASPSGGEGAAELAEAVVEACEQPNEFRSLYDDDEPIKEKIETIAERVYGADGRRTSTSRPSSKIEQFTRPGPRPSSRSAWRRRTCRCRPTRRCSTRPSDFTLPVRDMRAYTGAGWLVPLCGDMQQMPGLGKTAAAFDVDIDEEGRTSALF